MQFHLKTYEQHLNSSVIGNNEFGIVDYDLNSKSLKKFFLNLDKYKQNILLNKNKILLEKTNVNEFIKIFSK